MIALTKSTSFPTLPRTLAYSLWTVIYLSILMVQRLSFLVFRHLWKLKLFINSRRIMSIIIKIYLLILFWVLFLLWDHLALLYKFLFFTLAFHNLWLRILIHLLICPQHQLFPSTHHLISKGIEGKSLFVVPFKLFFFVAINHKGLKVLLAQSDDPLVEECSLYDDRARVVGGREFIFFNYAMVLMFSLNDHMIDILLSSED